MTSGVEEIPAGIVNKEHIIFGNMQDLYEFHHKSVQTLFQSPTNYHLFTSADLNLGMLKFSLLKCCICYIQHLPEGVGEV